MQRKLGLDRMFKKAGEVSSFMCVFLNSGENVYVVFSRRKER